MLSNNSSIILKNSSDISGKNNDNAYESYERNYLHMMKDIERDVKKQQ